MFSIGKRVGEASSQNLAQRARGQSQTLRAVHGAFSTQPATVSSSTGCSSTPPPRDNFVLASSLSFSGHLPPFLLLIVIPLCTLLYLSIFLVLLRLCLLDPALLPMFNRNLALLRSSNPCFQGSSLSETTLPSKAATDHSVALKC